MTTCLKISLLKDLRCDQIQAQVQDYLQEILKSPDWLLSAKMKDGAKRDDQHVALEGQVVLVSTPYIQPTL